MLVHVCLLDACLRLCEQKKLCNHLVLSMIREPPASPGSFPCFSILLSAHSCNAPAFSLSLALHPPYRTVRAHIHSWSCTSFSYGSRSAPISSTVVLSCFNRSLAWMGHAFGSHSPHMSTSSQEMLSGRQLCPALECKPSFSWSAHAKCSSPAPYAASEPLHSL